MSSLFPIHPRLVHFPIALSVVGIGFVLLAMFGPASRREVWMSYGQISLRLGWIGTLLATLSGLVDQNRVTASPAITAVLNPHITSGLALVVSVGLTIYWPLRHRRLLEEPGQRLTYLFLLVVVLLLLLLSSWLGGKLVYRLGVGIVS